MPPAERREAIVAAALAVMQRKGIAATTVRDVAAELGTSSGLIHHYVASMDDLLAEAFERAAGDDLRATEAAVARGRDPLERLSLFFDSYARGGDDSGMQLWLDAWAEAARRPALQRSSRALNIGWQSLLRRIINEGCAAGAMSCDDSEAASWRILSALDGLTLQYVAHGDAIDRDAAARWARGSAERELGLVSGTL